MLRRFLSILDRDSELVLSLARKFQFVQYCNLLSTVSLTIETPILCSYWFLKITIRLQYHAKVMQTLIFSTNFVAFQQKLKNIEWNSISPLGTVWKMSYRKGLMITASVHRNKNSKIDDCFTHYWYYLFIYYLFLFFITFLLIKPRWQLWIMWCR